MKQYNQDMLHNKGLITFSYDDGRRNNYELALPLHEEYGVPANFAIIAQRALDPQRWNRHMSPMQVVDASRRGIDISSHGWAHDSKFTDLGPDELTLELAESRKALEGFVRQGEKVTSLCIPYSAFNADVLAEAAKHYQIIRGHGDRLNEPLDGDPFVSSFPLTNKTRFSEIKKRIDRAAKDKKWLVLMLHGVVDAPQAQGLYDVSQHLLSDVLEYVTRFDQESLLPVTFKDVATLRELHRASDLRHTSVGPPANHTSDEGYPIKQHTVAEDPGYLITYHKNSVENNKLVISFGGLPSKKTPTGFGSKFLLKQGYDHIFVAQEARSQYQKLSLEDFTDAVAPYLAGRDVYTYGSSLGAYAALYFGGAINARIIASAPKNSAHPIMRKKSFEHVNFQHSELQDAPCSEHQPLVLFDPLRSEETEFIHHWLKPAYPEAQLIQLPYAGHTVLDTMQRSGVLKDFITSFIEDDQIIDFKLKEEGSFVWHAEKGRKLLRDKELNEAKRHFERSIQLNPNGDAVSGLVRVLLRLEEPQQAQDIFEDYFARTGGYKDVSVALRKSVSKLLEGDGSK